jgi:predicted transcriptional regulator of viral defense system
MRYVDLLEIAVDEPVIRSSSLLTGQDSPEALRVQLSRWCRSGHLVSLRRGVYLLGAPYRRREPHPFVLANSLQRASYVSLQSALAHHGLIPEGVPTVTSVTTGRPREFRTPEGNHIFRHVRRAFFTGYRKIEVSPGQEAFVATPEKALLDLVYLTPGGDETAFLESLRLQNRERLDVSRLARLAESPGSPKLARAVRRLAALFDSPQPGGARS